MPRLFVALELPESERQLLGTLGWGLPGAQWLEPDALHLTLAFMGEVDGPLAARVEQGLTTVAAAPFALRLAGLGRFPPRGAPRVLWAGVQPTEPVVALAHAVRERLRRLGAPLDSRRFAPHVTLARLRGTGSDALLARVTEQSALDGEPFQVEGFTLMASVLGRREASYRRLARYPLHPPWE